VKYNDDTDITPFGVNRPAPKDYAPNLAQAARGIEIELLRDPDGVNESGDEIMLGRFTDATLLNTIGTAIAPVKVSSHMLRYRVRFRYPVDRLVDAGGSVDADGKPCIDPNKQYMLDTPVFDDISITYVTKPRIMSYREVSE
jgi:hypothetical protein